MEQQDILILVYELKDSITNNKIYINVKEKENLMLEDKEAFTLLTKFQKVKDEYDNALRFETDKNKINEIRVKMFKVKQEVDENTFVKQYNEAYDKLNNLLKEIEKTIFKGIIDEKEFKKVCGL